MKTSELRAIVRRRYRGFGFAVFDEVRNETGWTTGKATRTCDMLAMSLWRSRGIELHGFELKVSRGDWLRELKQPDKSDAIAKYVERWWLVCAPGVAKLEELPPGWGLMVAGDHAGTGELDLAVLHRAPLREAVPMDKLFLAALVRKVGRGEMAFDGKVFEALDEVAGE